MRNTGLRFLLPYMRPYTGALLLGTLYAIIGAGASAFSPTLLGWAIDELNGGVRMQVLAIYAAGHPGAVVYAGGVSLPAAHAHRRDRRRRELPDEPGYVSRGC